MTPRLGPEDLRDHAVEARVDRVWERLEGNLSGELGRARQRRVTSRTTAYVAAALLVGFAAGVGSSSWRVGSAPLVGLTAPSRDPVSSVERAGQAEPTTAAATSRDEAAGARVEESARAGEPHGSEGLASSARQRKVASEEEHKPTASPAPAWVLACASDDYERAVELLDAEGGVASVLSSATNDQRLCLASGSRQRNQAELAKLALQRVADDSEDLERSAIAAAQLARIYEDEGNGAEQRRYEQLKEIRSKGRLLSESALCEKIQVQAEVGAHRSVVGLAQQYEDQYPSGTCSATVEALAQRARTKLAEAEASAAESGRADNDAARD